MKYLRLAAAASLLCALAPCLAPRAAAQTLSVRISATAPNQELASLPDAPEASFASQTSQQSQPGAPDTTGSSQSNSTPAAHKAPTPAASSQKESSDETLRREEHQRILGVMPEFNMVEGANGVGPLTPKQKFKLMFKSSTDPFIFFTAAFVAGYGQATDSNTTYIPVTPAMTTPSGKVVTRPAGFGQGADAYGQRIGGAYADTFIGNFFGNAVLPVVLREDPRYYRMGTGTFSRRFVHSAVSTVWCRRDNGSWGPNYANVLGNVIGGGISNFYYPDAERGVGKTFSGAATVTAEGVIGAELIEFWPDIAHHFFKKQHGFLPPIPAGTPAP